MAGAQRQVSADTDVTKAFFENPTYDPAHFGKAGSRQASQRWFQETQLHLVTTEQGFAEWFHGIITRNDSEQLLQNKPLGCFLIRVSESRFGYSLSFRAETRCRHYMIDQLPNGKFIVVGERGVHRSLHSMVEYYQKNTLSNWPHVLTAPCGQLDWEKTDYEDLFGDNEELYIQVRGGAIPTYLEPSMSSTGSAIPPDLPNRNYSLAGPPIPARPPPARDHSAC